MISIDDFKRIELRAARVESAERIPDSDKLLRLTVTMGGESRQILSGIGTQYAPEALVGRTVIVITNLEPRTILGLESQGMLLAVTNTDGSLALLTTDRPVSAGAPVS